MFVPNHPLIEAPSVVCCFHWPATSPAGPVLVLVMSGRNPSCSASSFQQQGINSNKQGVSWRLLSAWHAKAVHGQVRTWPMQRQSMARSEHGRAQRLVSSSPTTDGLREGADQSIHTVQHEHVMLAAAKHTQVRSGPLVPVALQLDLHCQVFML
jgi:hypothetical protein